MGWPYTSVSDNLTHGHCQHRNSFVDHARAKPEPHAASSAGTAGDGHLRFVWDHLPSISKNLIQPTKEIIADLIFSSAEHEESTSIHLQLIKDGLQLVAENPKVLLIGTGWGTEYENTRSFFPDTKYGNFHNTYISFVTQSGILSLICILALLIRPLVLKYPWGVLALVFLWSGLFYQYHGEPLWWKLLIP